MGLGDIFRKAIGYEDVEDDDELEEEVEVKKEPTFNIDAPSFATPVAAPAQPVVRETAKPDLTKTMGGRNTIDVKMLVVEPQGFEESPKLVDSLKAKKPVVINLENLETDVARKIFDFLSGATYALNGNVQKIANNIFLFAPANVDVSYNATQKQQTAEAPIKSPWR